MIHPHRQKRGNPAGRIGEDLTRLHRCMDLLRRGATEGRGVAGNVGLYLDGRFESSFAPGLLAAAKREMAAERQGAPEAGA